MDGVEILKKYFPHLEGEMLSRFAELGTLYNDWNSRINVISRKDMDHFYERHVLHSLGIARVMQFKPGTEILDVGTGGGFPGVPLAIMFPDSNFRLVDSIGKKIKVVQEVAAALGLKNLTAEHARAESIKEKFDFVVSRAVTRLPEFYPWIKNSFKPEGFNDLPNGVLYLKGGDLRQELAPFGNRIKVYPLVDHFEEEFFETKVVVYLKARQA